ncbi:hypothetical protein MJO28_011348 [Puccinia striiformis f. sp. tritici]|uniref:Uncharacterized protein n=1 Tax=Puccinia striiformis f. sp. tritici TaxID=168172 RepID=A0ACC0E2B3_9BASI|nr:hypothetical protein MJO28_011348 [Puccinia striiformis f. sp. tritici]
MVSGCPNILRSPPRSQAAQPSHGIQAKTKEASSIHPTSRRGQSPPDHPPSRSFQESTNNHVKMNNRFKIIILLFITSLDSLFASQHPHSTINHLKARDQPNGISKPCQTYYSANTPHAVCDGDRNIMCLAGCTGGVVAHNCQLDSSSQNTTQTCSVAFSQTSESAYLCNTPEGAYTCTGPQSGGVVCHNCVSTPNGVLPSNTTSNAKNQAHSGSNSTNEHQDPTSDSTRMIYQFTFSSSSLLISLFFTTASLYTLL